MIPDATFIYSDSGYAKVDKSRKMKQKQGRNMEKKGIKSHFEYKFHGIMYRDSELIKRFKTAI
jgi:hypothetical protein